MLHFLAMASNKVDFPDPFSPTKKVTGLLKVNSTGCPMAGILNG
jgi:hypothetical protein